MKGPTENLRLKDPAAQARVARAATAFFERLERYACETPSFFSTIEAQQDNPGFCGLLAPVLKEDPELKKALERFRLSVKGLGMGDLLSGRGFPLLEGVMPEWVSQRGEYPKLPLACIRFSDGKSLAERLLLEKGILPDKPVDALSIPGFVLCLALTACAPDDRWELHRSMRAISSEAFVRAREEFPGLRRKAMAILECPDVLFAKALERRHGGFTSVYTHWKERKPAKLPVPFIMATAGHDFGPLDSPGGRLWLWKGDEASPTALEGAVVYGPPDRGCPEHLVRNEEVLGHVAFWGGHVMAYHLVMNRRLAPEDARPWWRQVGEDGKSVLYAAATEWGFTTDDRSCWTAPGRDGNIVLFAMLAAAGDFRIPPSDLEMLSQENWWIFGKQIEKSHGAVVETDTESVLAELAARKDSASIARCIRLLRRIMEDGRAGWRTIGPQVVEAIARSGVAYARFGKEKEAEVHAAMFSLLAFFADRAKGASIFEQPGGSDFLSHVLCRFDRPRFRAFFRTVRGRQALEHALMGRGLPFSPAAAESFWQEARSGFFRVCGMESGEPPEEDMAPFL